MVGVPRGLPGVGVVGLERVGVRGASRLPATECNDEMDDLAFMRGLASDVMVDLYFFTAGPLLKGVCPRATFGYLGTDACIACSSA